jgi:hypothetical protein
MTMAEAAIDAALALENLYCRDHPSTTNSPVVDDDTDVAN